MYMSAAEFGTDLVITVDESRIDAAVALLFKERVKELTDHPAKRVILDLKKVEFLDSSGLGAVVSLMKHLGQGRRLDIAGPSPSVEKVFRITRMDRIFKLYPDAAAALLDVAHAT